MCKAVEHGNAQVLTDCRQIVRDPDYVPKIPKELCSRVFTTCYMGSENSSDETRNFAYRLSEQIGSHHITLAIDTVVRAVIATFMACMQVAPRFKAHGGSQVSDLETVLVNFTV